jgi:hypothetical protein
LPTKASRVLLIVAGLHLFCGLPLAALVPGPAGGPGRSEHRAMAVFESFWLVPVFVMLCFWACERPLPAAAVALGGYLALTLFQIVDPAYWSMQGFCLLRLVVILMLVEGVRSAIQHP